MLATVGAVHAADRIGIIDWYGYGNLDLAKLRAALPFRAGDALPSDKAREAAQAVLEKAAGRPALISMVCCLHDGRSSMFVGLAEPDAPKVAYNPEPAGEVRLPPEVLAIFRALDKDMERAVRKGHGEEDDSEGYALLKDPAARSDQLKLRDWTRAHTATVLHVLESSRYTDQRAYAAQALGYAERSPQQIAPLARAAFDANDGVRNAAVRALEVLCNVGPEVTRQVPAARFEPLLHSIVWTDRNKGAALFDALTESRDPDLLAMLRAKALAPLREMAQWKDRDHAMFALLVLGRIAGIEEARLQQLAADGKVEEILKAAQ